jgi:hypothetical protein
VSSPNRRFGFALAAIALAGFAVRLLFARHLTLPGGQADDLWYHTMANAIADGHGLSVPRDFLAGSGQVSDYSGATVPTAFHPPLFPALLAIPSKLGLTSYDEHRAIGCALGGATAAVVGIAGRRLAGPALGLVAAILYAVYVPAVANESALMSESLYGLTIAVALLAALWLVERPSPRRAALLGAAIGLAAMTRAEALLLVVLLVPLAVRHAGAGRLRLFLVSAAAALIVVAPWCVRNSLAFDRLTGISTGDGGVLAGANNQRAYHGPGIGAWNFEGLGLSHPERDGFDDAARSSRLRRKGLDYASDHAGRVPHVAVVRTLRTWTVYPFNPRAKVTYNSIVDGRRRGAEWAALLVGWAVMLLAVAGAVRLRRRGAPVGPLLAPIVLVIVVSALFFGDVRFREAADVSLVLLAAAAVAPLAAVATAAAPRARAPAAPEG